MTDERSPLERTRVALWALADEDAHVTAPRHLEAAVMRAWDEQHRHPGRARRWWVVAPFMARPFTVPSVVTRVALVSVAALALFWLAVPGAFHADDVAPSAPPVARVNRQPSLPVAKAAPQEAATAAEQVAGAPPPASVPEVPAHVPLPSVPPLAGGATVVFVGEPFRDNELARVIRMRVLREALASLGVTASSGAESVDVDVVVGEDGVARGLRVGM